MSAVLPTPLELGSIRLTAPVAAHATRLPWQFTLMCWSVGLLFIGLWITYAGVSPRVEVGEVVLFIAAVIAAVPLILRFFVVDDTNSDTSVTDHLVAVAIVAALATGEYITAVLVPLVMDLGHLIEHYSILRSTSLIDGMKSLYSRPATLIEEGREIVVAPDQVRVGQMLLIRPGEMIVADGEITMGHGMIDESAITGESFPRDVTPGDLVRGGTICVNGQLQVAVTHTGDETTIGRVRSMLANAVLSKAPITRTLESYAQLYAPIVLLIAAATLILTGDLKRVITVLVVSCPCSLILSGPLAMMIALSVASRRGILVKNAKFLESLAHVDVVVFDKTGTLTEGILEVQGTQPWGDEVPEKILDAASVCAAASCHPIARAILRSVPSTTASVAHRATSDVHDVPGRGVEVLCPEGTIRLGRTDWVAECCGHQITPPDHAGPLVAVSSGSTFLGWILLRDRLRAESPAVIEELRGLGIERVMLLTGDRQSVATVIANQLQLDRIVAEALPEQKLEIVREESQSGHRVLVVGDGVNDALALAAGSVGIALGARGADLAIQSADIALLTNDLHRVVDAIRLSRQTNRTIRQNVLIATLTSGVMLAMGSLGWMNALPGAILHNIGTVLVLINSARMLRAP